MDSVNTDYKRYKETLNRKQKKTNNQEEVFRKTIKQRVKVSKKVFPLLK